MNRILTLLICLIPAFSFAQDSVTVFYTASGKITGVKDSAQTYTVFTKQGKGWYGKSYWVKNNRLESQGTFSKMDINTPTGRFDNYTDSGFLYSTHEYDKRSRLTSITQYYGSGKKMSYIEWKRNGATEQLGWDEQGNLIPGYIVQQEAGFPGGLDGWKAYLEKHLDSRVPEKHNAPPGRYTVIVSFRIDKEGKITEVRAENIPPSCVPCALEAVRVIRDGPDWIPAVQNNKKVIFRQRQSITFVLEEERERKPW